MTIDPADLAEARRLAEETPAGRSLPLERAFVLELVREVERLTEDRDAAVVLLERIANGSYGGFNGAVAAAQAFLTSRTAALVEAGKRSARKEESDV